MTEVRPVTFEDALYVSERMRDADWRELSAQRFSPTRELFAHEAVAAAGRGPAAIVALDGRPVVVGGVALHNPGCASMWMWATDEFRKVVKTTARMARMFKASCRDVGVHRFQALSHAEHAEAHRWIRFLGLEMECRLSRYGAGGEDFIMFAEVA